MIKRVSPFSGSQLPDKEKTRLRSGFKVIICGGTSRLLIDSLHLSCKSLPVNFPFF
jgi:hypothetical protein